MLTSLYPCTLLTVPLAGKAGGDCSESRRCEDANAECRNNKCECKQGYTAEHTDLTCSKQTQLSYQLMDVHALLTPSFPWCHLKTTHKNGKFKTPKPFCFCFLHWHVKGSPSKCIESKIDVIGPENILSAGSSVHHSARIFYRLEH